MSAVNVWFRRRVPIMLAMCLDACCRVIGAMHGNVLQSPHQLTEELIVADLEVSAPEPTAVR